MGDASPHDWPPDDNLPPPDQDGNPPMEAVGPQQTPPTIPPILPPGLATSTGFVTFDGMIIPYARPAPREVTYSGVELINYPLLRALLEILAVVGGTFMGGLGISLTLYFVMRAHDERDISIPSTLVLGTAMIVLCVSLLRQMKLPLSSIGLSTHRLASNILLGVGGFVGLLILLIIILSIVTMLFPSTMTQLERHGEETTQAIREVIPRTSIRVMLPFLTFVAFWEELVFRGFLLTRLKVLLKSWWLVVPVGSLLFGLGHFYEGGLLGILKTAILGMIFGLLFAWRKSLVPAIVFHLIWNSFALLTMNAQP